MSLSEFETRRISRVVGDFVEAHRPPPHIRQQVDLGFRFQNQSVEIFEIPPRFKGAAGETTEGSVAKSTFIKARGHWKVFWQRADLKWHPYPPAPVVGSIEEFLALVAEDKQPASLDSARLRQRSPGSSPFELRAAKAVCSEAVADNVYTSVYYVGRFTCDDRAEAGDVVRRIISARLSNRHERQAYRKIFTSS